VAYSGQAARHLLLAELTARIGATTDDVAAGRSKEQLLARFNFLYDFKAANGGTPEEPVSVTAFGTPLQQTEIGQVGVASLRDKVRDIETGLLDDTPVIGWGDDTLTASEVVNDLFNGLADNLLSRQTSIPTMPGTSTPISAAFVSADGLDYQQLIEKYLVGAVAFSQNCDDYLDDDTAGEGILADNIVPVTDKPYTALEHGWDEGFGYFGAARAYGVQTREQNVSGFVNADGLEPVTADWLTEVNYGHARLAAQRDAASVTSTTFGQSAFAAYVAGRALITEAGGALSPAQLETLRTLRNTAEQNWEKAIAATAIRYINVIVAELEGDVAEYSFLEHVKVWSELKGVLLAVQFNPRSPVLANDAAVLRQLHTLVGAAPVVDRDDFAVAIADLDAARELLRATYGFDEQDVAAW
jgi:hypothetical protein